jgi:hypothetical protein
MPAVSEAQRRLMAIAKHHPEKLKKKNRGVLSMSKAQLSEFAKKPKKHQNALRAAVLGDEGE